MNWYVKKEDGTQYGPEPLTLLQRWAEEGRIGSEDLVSCDGQAWIPAVDQKSLGLNWMIELTDRDWYGPVHVLALQEPLCAGELFFHTRIRFLPNGKSHLLGEVLFNAMADKIDTLLDRIKEMEREVRRMHDETPAQKLAQPSAERNASGKAALEQKNADLCDRLRDAETAREDLQQRLAGMQKAHAQENADLRDRLRDAEKAHKDLQQRLDAMQKAHAQENADLRDRLRDAEKAREDLQQRLADMEKDRVADAPSADWTATSLRMDRIEKEKQKWEQLYEKETREASQREKKLKERVDELRKSESEALSSLHALEARLKRREESLEQLKDISHHLASEGVEGGRDLVVEQVAALLDAYNELSHQHQILSQQLSDRNREKEAMMANRSAIEEQADKEVHILEERLKREQTEANNARRSLADMEKGYLDLLDSYREINARFIRFQDDVRRSGEAARPPAGKTGSDTESVA